MHIVLLMGLPGSGKSTWANLRCSGWRVVSADHYFMVKGNYCFNPARLGEAHAQCLRRFLGAVSRKENVVVDNTNTSLLELAPYVSLAQAYRYDLELIYVECSPELSAARNTHGVPAETVGKMHRALQETLKSIPPWWPQVKVIPQGSF